MVDVKKFYSDPYVLMLGMSVVNVGSGLWVLIATTLSLPVSTTHAVVGAVLGLGIAAFGVDGVKWQYEGGFLGVLASWFISPICSGALAAIFYMSVKALVLKLPTDEQRLKSGLALMPAYFFFGFGTIWGFMMMKGIPIPAIKKADPAPMSGVIVGLAVFHALHGFACVVPWLRRTIMDNENLPWYTAFYAPCVGVGAYGYTETNVDNMKGEPAVFAVSDENTVVAGGNMGQEDGAPTSAMDSIGKAIAPGFYM
jgi:sodium-dependent phosphate transporter